MAQIEEQFLQNQAAGGSYDEVSKSLRIQALRNIKLLEQLAKRYPETEELILEAPETLNYYRKLGSFGKLNTLRLNYQSYFPGIEESKTQSNPSPVPVQRLCLTETSLLDEGFAELVQFLAVEELELTGVDIVTEGFWEKIQSLLGNMTALSIRRIEMSGGVFEKYLPAMKRLRRLALSAFCSNQTLLRQLNVSDLTELEELEISNVGIQALPRGFSRLLGLKRLNVSNSPLVMLDDCGPSERFPHGSITNLTEKVERVLGNLEVLDISRTGLRKLPGNLKGMRLRELHAGFTELQNLPGCFLPESIEVLEIPNASLEALPEAAFEKLSALKVLDVSYTQMKKLPDRAGCQKSLKILRLWGISGLHRLPGWVAECTSMDILDLRQLQLEQIPENLLRRKLEFCESDSWKSPSAFRFNDPDSLTNSGTSTLNSVPAQSGCHVMIRGIRLNTLDPKLLLTNDTSLLCSYVEADKSPIRRGNLIFLGDSGDGKRALIEQITGTELSEWEDCVGMRTLEDAFAFERLAQLADRRPQNRIRVRMVEMSEEPPTQLIHPLFLTNHSLYVIVLDGRQEFRIQERAVWWGRLVEAYAPDAHIIFVVRQDSGGAMGLNIPLLRQEIWMDQEPEVVYLPGKGPTEENCLCEKIVTGIQDLMLERFCLPDSWIRLLSHFEQLLETRMMLPQDIFSQLMERYIHPGSHSSEDKYLRKYLLAFESETVGCMAHISGQDTESMFFHTGWLGEGLYRLARYAQEYSGVIESPQVLWGALADSARRNYSLAHVKMLLEFCERQGLCFQTKKGFIFPCFTSELEEPGRYAEEIRRIQTEERAAHYTVRCPMLSRMMLSQLVAKLVRGLEGALRVVTGQSGLLLETTEAGTLLLLGRTESSAQLCLHFSRIPSAGGEVISESAQIPLMECAFSALEQVLDELPAHLRGQYQISIQRFTGSLSNPRFSKQADISIEELRGYYAAGRSSYFCGILNQTFEIRELGYLPFGTG